MHEASVRVHIGVAVSAVFATFVCWTGTATATVTAQPFSDVPRSHAAFEAVEYLRERLILDGYPDGTFKPNALVNRAEAVKMIIAQVASQSQIDAVTNASVYADVPEDAWFAPFVEYARRHAKIIDGPPQATSFAPTRPVQKVEFLKMILLAKKIDPVSQFGEIRLALATDVTNPDEWYYPFMRYAITSSMTLVTPDGLLTPGAQLTRGNVALLLHRLEMYQEGRRTQALLSETENEIINVLKMLEEKSIAQAHYASARALLAARGALASKPNENIVKGAVKTAEGFRSLTLAYQAGSEGRLQDAIDLSSEAWHAAQRAREFSSNLDTVATQMQTIAKSMADEARALLPGQ